MIIFHCQDIDRNIESILLTFKITQMFQPSSNAFLKGGGFGIILCVEGPFFSTGGSAKAEHNKQEVFSTLSEKPIGVIACL